MMQELSELLKRHRNAMGRLVLVLGSGIPLRPDRLSNQERIGQALADYAERLGSADASGIVSADATDPDMATAHHWVAPHFRDVEPSEGHLRLARLVQEGFFPTVITTGIDDLLERALAQEHMHPEEQYNLVNVGMSTRREIMGAIAESRRVTLVKALGTLGSGSFAFTRKQTQSFLRRIQRFIYDSAACTLIFVGYSARDADLIASMRREGGAIWWVNPRYPLGDPLEYDRMKIEAPESLRFHEPLPAVVELLEARRSERTILCRDMGHFDNFFRELYDRRVRKARDRGEGNRPRVAITLQPEAPYRLLEPMEMRDGPIFHGREEELGWIERALAERNLVVVFGKPGIGKTSMANAGVAPRLVDENKLPVVFRCGLDPRAELLAALARASAVGDEADLPIDVDVRLLDAVRQAREVTGSDVVFIVDQAEELITRIGPRTRTAFLDEFAAVLADERCGSRALLFVADWAFAHLYDLNTHLPGIYEKTLRLDPFSPADALHVIIRSAARYERRWEEDAYQAVVDDLGPEEIHPADLAIVCHRTYATLGRARVVRLRAYESLGRSQRILSNFLAESLQTIAWRDREAARQILRSLVRSGDTKGPLELEQIVARCPRLDRDRVERLLWALTDARLVTRQGREGARRYELVNDWVIPQILESVTPEQRLARASEDAVSRGLSDWRLFGEVLPLQVLRSLTRVQSKLRLTREELALVLHSAARRGEAFASWLDETKRLEGGGVALLRDLLTSAPEGPQRLVAERLDAIGSEEAVQVLLECLGDLPATVATTVREALEKRGALVAAAVRDSLGEKRTRTIEALGAVATPEVVQPLIDVMDDDTEDASVREVAVSALTSVAQRSGGRASAGLIARLAEAGGVEVDYDRATALARVVIAEGEMAGLYRAAEARGAGASLRASAVLAAIEARDLEVGEHHHAALVSEHPSVLDSEAGRRISAALEDLRRREEAGHFEWAMFGRDAAHSSYAWRDGPAEPYPLWRYRANGQVMGSPVVSKGQCFIGAKDGILRAVESQTGREQWARALGLGIEATPAISDELVVVGCVDHRVYACDRKTGRVRWHTEIDDEIRASSTLVEGSVLAATRGGHLYRLSLGDGSVMWQSHVGGPAYACPACAEGRVFIGSWAGAARCLDLETGHELYSVDLRGEVNCAASVSPDGLVAIGSDAGEVTLFRAESGEVVRVYETEGAVRSAPVIRENDVYVGSGDGAFYGFALDSATPRFTVQTSDPIVCSPAITPGAAIFGSRDGSLYSVSRADGSVVFRIDTSYSIVSSPAVVDGVIYVGMEYYEVHALGSEPQGGAA